MLSDGSHKTAFFLTAHFSQEDYPVSSCALREPEVELTPVDFLPHSMIGTSPPVFL